MSHDQVSVLQLAVCLPYRHSLTNTTAHTRLGGFGFWRVNWLSGPLECCVLCVCVNELPMNVYVRPTFILFYFFEWALVHFIWIIVFIFFFFFCYSSSVAIKWVYFSLWYNQNKSPTRGPFMLDVTKEEFGSKKKTKKIYSLSYLSFSIFNFNDI